MENHSHTKGAPAGEREAVPDEKQYPSMSLYPDAKEYAAACGEVAGWNACRKAVLAAQQRTQPAGVPEGWKLVPEQPTDSMVQAVIDSGYYATPATAWTILVEEYKAMLAAAPAQSEKVAHSAQWPTTPGLAAASARLEAQPPASRDWVEDFDHENGCYSCLCSICKQEFTGHKRRVVCKECSQQTPAQPEVQENYPECDYCGVTPDHHPWHGSGLLGGVESRHIHACDSCRHLLPASPAQPEVQRLREALEGMLEYFPEGASDGECFAVDAARAALAALAAQEVER